MKKAENWLLHESINFLLKKFINFNLIKIRREAAKKGSFLMTVPVPVPVPVGEKTFKKNVIFSLMARPLPAPPAPP